VLKFTETLLDQVWIVEPQRFEDARGYFQENFKLDELTRATGYKFSVEQVNQSKSALGVLRGIHWFDNPPGQAKYVTVQRGAIADFIVDIRRGSPTFGSYVEVHLDESSAKAVFIPPGFGHAFLSLANESVVTYLCSKSYDPTREHGVNPLDASVDLQLDRLVSEFGIETLELSPKDSAAPSLLEAAELGILPAYSN
jgi:dTDP-4-dehydrorhamnose 3,5-epimerase